jgi:hypothetical protein
METTQEQNLNSPLKSVGGWLAFFCFSLILLGPLNNIITTVVLYTRFSREDFNFYYGLRTALLIDMVLTAFLTVFSVYTGARLALIKRNAVRGAKFFLVTVLLYNTVYAFLFFFSPFKFIFSDAEKWLLFASQIVFSLFSFTVWFLYLSRSKRVISTYGNLGQTGDQAMQFRFEAARDYSSMFDKKTYGIVYWVGLAYICAATISTLTGYLIIETTPNIVAFPHLVIFYAYIAVAIVKGCIFVLISHTIKRKWLLAFLWGAVCYCSAILIYMVNVFFRHEALDLSKYLVPSVIISWVVVGILQIGGLLLAVRLFGATLWSLVIGFLAGFCSYGFFDWLYTVIVSEPSPQTIQDWIVILASATIYGTFFYTGLKLHYDRSFSGESLSAHTKATQ